MHALLQQGLRVCAMVRPGKESDSRIPVGCEQVPVALTDVDELSRIISQCGIVIYCAGSVRGRTSADFATANIKGVQAILEAMKNVNSEAHFLLMSSLAAGKPQLSDYANSKFAGEQVLQDFPALNWTIFRPPAVYGPGDKEMLPVMKMMRRGLLAHAGPVDQCLSLLHVDDLANAVISWLSAPHKCRHQTYALDDGTPGGYSWTSMAEAVCDRKFRILRVPRFLLDGAARLNLLFSGLLGYSPMLSPGKVRELVEPEWLGDNRAFSEATGWQPLINLRQGAERLFKS